MFISNIVEFYIRKRRKKVEEKNETTSDNSLSYCSHVII